MFKISTDFLWEIFEILDKLYHWLVEKYHTRVVAEGNSIEDEESAREDNLIY